MHQQDPGMLWRFALSLLFYAGFLIFLIRGFYAGQGMVDAVNAARPADKQIKLGFMVRVHIWSLSQEYRALHPSGPLFSRYYASFALAFAFFICAVYVPWYVLAAK
jgi:hypothetical protein